MRVLVFLFVAFLAVDAQLNCSIAYTSYLASCVGCIYNPAAPFILPPPYNNLTQTIAALEVLISQLQANNSVLQQEILLLQGNLTQTNNSLISCQGLLNACDHSINNNATSLSSCNAQYSQLQTSLALNTGILPQFAMQPASAYSTRQLSYNYTGPILRIYRSNDSQQQDIVAQADGWINTTALLAFVGSQTALVSVLYDQTGGGTHYFQNDPLLMPYIAINGYVLTQGGRPTIVWNSTNTAGSLPAQIPVSLVGGQKAVAAASLVINIFSNTTFTNTVGVMGTLQQLHTQTGVAESYGFCAATAGFPDTWVTKAQSTSQVTTMVGNIISWNWNTVSSAVGTANSILAYPTGVLGSVYWASANPIPVNTFGSFAVSNFEAAGSQAFMAISEILLWTLQPSPFDQQVAFNDEKRAFNIPTSISEEISVQPNLAFSVRQQTAYNYGGYCMQVRRSSDGTTQNIGFTPFGDLDVSGLLAFVGTGNGTVATWYDQSGHTLNALQATANLQPFIVINGVVLTENGRPSIKFTGSNYLAVAGYVNAGNTVYSSVVASQTGNTNGGILSLAVNQTSSDNTTTGIALLYQTNNPAWAIYRSGTGYSAYPAVLNSLQVVGSSVDGINNIVYLQGGNVASTPAVANISFNVHLLWIGAEINTTVNNFFQGMLSEVTVFNTIPNFYNLGLLVNTQRNYFQIGGLPMIDALITTSQLNLSQPLGSNWLALSVRKLTNAYTGPCMRVRRDSDNSTKDIGFLSTNDMDVAGLLQFVGSANGFVNIWYDQGSLNASAIQPNATQQPQIVSQGTLISNYGNRPALQFSQPNDTFLVITGFTDTTNGIYGNIVGQVSVNNSFGARVVSCGQSISSGDEGELDFALLAWSNSIYYYYDYPVEYYNIPEGYYCQRGSTRVYFPATSENNEQFVPYGAEVSSFQIGVSGSTQALAVNAQLGTTQGSNTPFGIGVIYIGSQVNNISNGFNGQLHEVVIGTQLPASNVQTFIQQNDMRYYQTFAVQTDQQVGTFMAVAYGFNTWGIGYYSALITVRRSSDNATLNIFGDVLTGWLNVTQLMDFVGPGSGFVTSWGGQTQNAIATALVQAVNSQQPMIVNNGVLVTQNGQPCMYFNASQQQYLSGTFTQTNNNEFEFLIMASITANAAVGARIVSFSASGGSDNVTNGFIPAYVTSAAHISNNKAGVIGTSEPFAVGVLHRIVSIAAGTNMTISVDNSEPIGTTISSANFATPATLTVGAGHPLGNYLDGYVCKLVIYEGSAPGHDAREFKGTLTFEYGTP